MLLWYWLHKFSMNERLKLLKEVVINKWNVNVIYSVGCGIVKATLSVFGSLICVLVFVYVVGNCTVEKRRREEKAWHLNRETEALKRREQARRYGGVNWKYSMHRAPCIWYIEYKEYSIWCSMTVFVNTIWKDAFSW